MRRALTLNCTLILIAGGCGDGGPPASPRPRSPHTSQTTEPSTPAQPLSIPSDVSYTIIETTTVRGIKRVVDVRLNKSVSEETLRAIASELRSQDSRHYERTLIGYYLPGMVVGAGSWATTHFDPDLEVRIHGLSPEDEAQLVGEPVPASREVIGRWLEQQPPGGPIMIFREDGHLFMEQKFKDRSVLTEEVVEKASQRGRLFEWARGSPDGEHYVCLPDGTLEIRSAGGLLWTAQRIK